MTTEQPSPQSVSPPTGPGPGPGTAPAPTIEDAPVAERDGPFHLVLIDDDEHTYAYVIEMLGRVFGYGKEKAYTLASLVDAEGRVVVETGGHERVTRHQSQIHSYGADPRIPSCKGAMSAIVEESGGHAAGG